VIHLCACVSTLLLLSVLSGCVVTTTQAQKGQSALQQLAEMKKPGLKVKNDEFTGESVAYTPLMAVGEDMELMVLASRSPKNDVLISLKSYSDNGWEYLRCHHLHWLADGRRVDAPESKHDGHVSYGSSVIEDIEQHPVAESEFLKLATAKQVRGRLCNTEFQLQPSHIGELRSLAAWMGLIEPRNRSDATAPASPAK
jgi:hypothetical protein